MKIERSRPHWHILFANSPEGVMLIVSDGCDCGDASADLGRSEKKKKESEGSSPVRSRIDYNVIK